MGIFTILHNPVALWGVIAVVAAAVHALPEPTTSSSMFYRWLYGFAHALPANWANVAKAIQPPAPQG
jgi:hypothetical protein